MAIDLTTTITPSTPLQSPLQSPLLDPPFWFCRKLKRSQAEKYPDSRESVYTTKLSGFKSFRIQCSHFKFRIQNLRRHDQTGDFLFRIHPLICKRQKQSGNKTFRIRHESGAVSFSVNRVLYEALLDRQRTFEI